MEKKTADIERLSAKKSCSFNATSAVNQPAHFFRRLLFQKRRCYRQKMGQSHPTVIKDIYTIIKSLLCNKSNFLLEQTIFDNSIYFIICGISPE